MFYKIMNQFHVRLYKPFLHLFIALIITLIGSLNQRSFGHEITPAIAELSFKEETVQIDITLSVELFLADIDASSATDTNETEKSDIYDELRRRKGEEIKQLFISKYSSFSELITLSSQQQSLTAQLADILVVENDNVMYPRESRITLIAPINRDDIKIEFGWDKRLGPLIIRQVSDSVNDMQGIKDEQLYSAYLAAGELSAPILRDGVTAVSTPKLIVNYIIIGFEHIIPKGLDHILFVFGLFLFATRFSQLAAQISLFTIAHTITLALASLSIVSVPSSIVEPIIALSITYVALETLWHKRVGWSRLTIIFGFGLLHGLGFASVLLEIGLSPQHFITSLIAFNVGVELGQIAVLLIAYLLIGIWFSKRRYYRSVVQIPASLIVASIGAWWFIERTFL